MPHKHNVSETEFSAFNYQVGEIIFLIGNNLWQYRARHFTSIVTMRHVISIKYGYSVGKKWSFGGKAVVIRWSFGCHSIVIRWSFDSHSVVIRWESSCHSVVIRWSFGGEGWDLPMDFINYFSIEFNL